MIFARITAAQERWLVFAERYTAWRNTEAVVAGAQGWRTVSFLARCGFFVLGLLAALAACGLFFLMFKRYTLLPAGIILWVISEWLTHERRVIATGFAEACLLLAVVLLALGLLDVLDNFSNDRQVFWTMSIACVLAGLRLLNPLFTTLGVMGAAYALYASLHASNYEPEHTAMAMRTTGVVCFAVAALALGLGGRRWQRPSHDRMLDWLVVVMPLMGYWYLVQVPLHLDDLPASLGVVRGSEGTLSWLGLLAVLAYGGSAVWLALRRRSHAPLFAAMGCGVCLAYELRHVTGMPLYGRMMVWGSVLLLASYWLERWLRTPRAGITSAQLQDHDTVLNVAELAGSSMAAPAQQAATTAPAQPTLQGQGGEFGGGGASGKF